MTNCIKRKRKQNISFSKNIKIYIWAVRHESKILYFILKKIFFFLVFFFYILEAGEDFKAIYRALRQARISAMKGLIERALQGEREPCFIEIV